MSTNSKDVSQYEQKKPADSKLTVMIHGSNSSLAYLHSSPVQPTNSME